MRRCVALMAVITLLASCCVGKSGGPGIKALLWSDGEARPRENAEELAALALALLEAADDEARLIVGPDLIDSLKASGTALEIIWPDTLTVTLPSGVKDRLDRILLPLTGEYAPDGASALILYGIKDYGTPALLNNAPAEELNRMGELLEP